MIGERSWRTRLEIEPGSVGLQVTDQGRAVLKARFCGAPHHSRALPFILEGLALWQGQRLCVVISAERAVHPGLGLGRDGDEWPAESALVEFQLAERPSRGRRDSGRAGR